MKQNRMKTDSRIPSYTHIHSTHPAFVDDDLYVTGVQRPSAA